MDLNAKCKTMKLLEENIEGKLHDVGFDNNFLGRIPKTQASKNKLDYIKIKNFYVSKNTINGVKRQPI